jgi:cysteine synthase
MHSDRYTQYDDLRSIIGGTPLVELNRIDNATDSRIFLKQEFRNPTGSHYDRIMLELLFQREESHEIWEGMTLLDTTTGNSGAALAWLAGILDFHTLLIIPEDAPRARRSQIESLGGTLLFSPAGEYTDGLVHMLKGLVRNPPWSDFDHVLDHAAALTAPTAAMKGLGIEIREQFADQFPGQTITHVIVGLGNGASVHLAAPLKQDGCKVIGFEPIRAPTHFLLHYSHDELRARYGAPPPFSLNHGLWGTGAGIDNEFKWPLMKAGWYLIDDVALVDDADWLKQCRDLADKEGLHVGRSTGAGLAVALRLAEQLDEPGNILCIGYDAAWKYLE